MNQKLLVLVSRMIFRVFIFSADSSQSSYKKAKVDGAPGKFHLGRIFQCIIITLPSMHFHNFLHSSTRILNKGKSYRFLIEYFYLSSWDTFNNPTTLCKLNSAFAFVYLALSHISNEVRGKDLTVDNLTSLCKHRLMHYFEHLLTGL